MHLKNILGGLVIAALFVACPTDPEIKNNFSVGGSVTGLTGSGLVLQNNSTDNLNVNANGSFTFAKTLADGTAYSVTVLTQPVNPSQTCIPTKNTGVIATANITNVVITCTTPSSGSNVITSIGTTGGTATGNYDAKIIIPAGALTSTLEIGMARDSSNAPAFTLPDIDFAGAPYELTPHGTTFAVPVTVRIPFDPTQVPDGAIPTLYKAETGGTFAAIPTTVDGNMLVANISSFSWVLPAYAATKPRNVYAIQAAGFPAVIRVASYKINSTTGALSGPTSTALTGESPISVVAHPSGRFLFVLNGGVAAANGISPNSVTVYQLDAVNGKISESTSTVGTGFTDGNRPVRAVVHPSGKFLYVINFASGGLSGNGNIAFYTIDGSTGALSGPTGVADSNGQSPASIAFNPTGTFAYVSYKFVSGSPYTDKINVYSVNATTGELTGPISNATAGYDPWALTIEPNGKFAYVANIFADEVQVFGINATTGALSELSKIHIDGKPSSIAADSFGRFLYVGRQTPNLNINVLAYRINPNSGGLSPVGDALSSCVGGGCVGPIAVLAEPQGQFVYAIDVNRGLSSFQVNNASGALSGAGAVPNVLNPWNGGVGVPFGFAATGSYPLWQNGCTVDCTLTPPTGSWCCPYASSGGGGGGGGGSGGVTNQNPPTKHYLSVTRGAWGGFVVSSPAGIKYGDPTQGNQNVAEFSKGSTVQLTVTSPSSGTAYNVSWSGCSFATTASITVQMNSDKTCHVELTPK
jgi:6-phosphogluconolactonase